MSNMNEDMRLAVAAMAQAVKRHMPHADHEQCTKVFGVALALMAEAYVTDIRGSKEDFDLSFSIEMDDDEYQVAVKTGGKNV